MEKDKRLMEASWWERVTEGGTGLVLFDRAILCVAQMVKRPPAMRETRVRSLGWEDPLEKVGKATHSSILSWRIPWTSP